METVAGSVDVLRLHGRPARAFGELRGHDVWLANNRRHEPAALGMVMLVAWAGMGIGGYGGGVLFDMYLSYTCRSCWRVPLGF